MPGIADEPNAQLQLGASSPIEGGAPDVNVSSLGALPSFDNFMNAFRSGFITADDIKKRRIVGTTGAEAEREENIARKAGAQQSQIDIGEIRPKQRALASEQLTGATTEQSLLNRMNDANPDVSYPAREQFAQRQLDAQATAVYGTPTPNLFKSTEREPEDFESWKNRQVNAFQGTDKARAEYSNHLDEKGEQGEEYAKYKKAVKDEKTPLSPGTPEYKKALREHVHEALTYEQLAQINFDVMKESAVARAKGEAEAIAKTPILTRESEDKLRAEVNNDKSVEQIIKSQNYLNDARNVLNAPKGTLTNADDQVLVESFVKLLDPQGVIRQSKIEYLKEMIPLENRFKLALNKLKGNKNAVLTQDERDQIAGAIDKIQQANTDIAKSRFNFYSRVAENRGAHVNNVLSDDFLAVASGKQPFGPGAAPTSPKTALPANFAPPTSQEAAGAPTYPALNAVPANVRVYKTPDGKLWGNPNFKP